MIRNLKALGLAFVAVFAMSAVAASAAQASAHARCGNGEGTCTVTFETHPQSPIQKFTTDVGTVECKEFHADYAGPKTISESATLTNVEYNKCTVGGALEAHVNFGTCDYTLESPFETFEGHGRGGVTLGPPSCTVTITVTTKPCTITVPGGQTFANAITYTNVQTEGKPKEITGHANAKGIKYSYKGTACGEGNNTENGTYEGTFTAKAYSTGQTEQTDLQTVDT